MEIDDIDMEDDYYINFLIQVIKGKANINERDCHMFRQAAYDCKPTIVKSFLNLGVNVSRALLYCCVNESQQTANRVAFTVLKAREL